MILEISASQLSFGMQGDDITRGHQALQALGRDIPIVETANRALGAGTVSALKALQAEFTQQVSLLRQLSKRSTTSSPR